MLIGFDEIFFHEKKPDEKSRAKKPDREHGFFPFPKEARPCLSRNHNRASRGSKTVTLVKGKKQKTHFFPFRKRHARNSRESTTVPLAKAKP